MPYRLIIFQQNGSAEKKIAGLLTYGTDLEICANFALPTALPDFIDEPHDFFPDHLEGDLILNFLKHPDLADYLVELAARCQIPVITSGPRQVGDISPFTCCGLARRNDLGAYGTTFGVPEYKVTCLDGLITDLEVSHGASCGATWQVRDALIGLPVDEAWKRLPARSNFCARLTPAILIRSAAKVQSITRVISITMPCARPLSAIASRQEPAKNCQLKSWKPAVCQRVSRQL